MPRWTLYAVLAILSSVVLHACERVDWIVDRAECIEDDDCGLMPSAMTCCGECDPVPPFEAVARTAIDARLLELDTRCAERSIECVPPTCAVPPPGCSARAVCVRGVCRVVEAGCDTRVAYDPGPVCVLGSRVAM